MTQITDAMISAYRNKFREIWPGSHPDKKTTVELLTAALASLSHTMGVKGDAERYAETLARNLAAKHYPENTEWKPLEGDIIGLLTQIDNMVAGLVRSALTPTQQPVAWRWRFEVDGPWYHGSTDPAASKFMGGKPVQIEPLYALASPQAVPGWEKALEALEPFAVAEEYVGDRMPDDNGNVFLTALGLNLGRIRNAARVFAALNAEVKK